MGIRLSSSEAEALGLSGPMGITPEEAQALGLSQAATGALVTDDDKDRLGLYDPPGWNATGYTHLKQARQMVLEAARIKLEAHTAVRHLLNQQMKASFARKKL